MEQPSSYAESRRVCIVTTIALALRRVSTRPIIANLRKRLGDTDFSLQAAGIAFFAFLSIVPLIGSFALAYGLFAQPRVLKQHLEDIKRLFPRETAEILQEPIRLALESAGAKQGLALIMGLIVAIFAARGAASAIITALNNAYDREETRSFLRLQGTALLLTAAIIVTLVTTFSIASFITSIGTRFLPASPVTDFLLTIMSVGLLTAISAAVVASMFRWVPDHTEARWKWITPGSVMTAVAWFLLSSSFSWYADHFGKFGTVYGSLGAIVALLTWLYFSAMALFAGACLNRSLEAVAIPEIGLPSDRDAAGSGSDLQQ
ncbi:YihY/virulence factor BrkB family protein [Novosphingobium olei]|uniref:YihY/virulence factor BrkB family protein n=1 Tax=Novosphingobium olei TaxID=2728851 RepID=A0A7Y0GCH4_9SPHN|nr:YihY/virulence factor BrkB family protein [Novosphingobium olei]NML96218.1 YihY/virulence factor BrkB family protein [Novosphingobium olei]